MFKNILTCLCLIIFVCLTTGCAKFQSSIEIDNSDNVKIEQLMALNKQKAIELFGEDANWEDNSNYAEFLSDLKEKGYEIEEYLDESDGFQGIKIKKEIKAKMLKAQELPSGFELAQETDMPIKIIKTPFKTKYEIHMRFDLSKIDGLPKRPSTTARKRIRRVRRSNPSQDLQDSQDPMNPDINQDNMNSEDDYDPSIQEEKERWAKIDEVLRNPDSRPSMELTIRIPKKASENNASEVISSRLYKWDLSLDKSDEIILKYEKWNILSLLVLFIVVFATLSFLSNNKKYIVKEEDEETKNAF